MCVFDFLPRRSSECREILPRSFLHIYNIGGLTIIEFTPKVCTQAKYLIDMCADRFWRKIERKEKRKKTFSNNLVNEQVLWKKFIQRWKFICICEFADATEFSQKKKKNIQLYSEFSKVLFDLQVSQNFQLQTQNQCLFWKFPFHKV